MVAGGFGPRPFLEIEMSWTLKIWWAYSDRDQYRPAFIEQFDTKAEGQARALEVIEDGWAVDNPGEHDYLPSNAITHVSLYEDPPPE